MLFLNPKVVLKEYVPNAIKIKLVNDKKIDCLLKILNSNVVKDKV